MKDKPLEFFEDSYRKSKLKIFLCYLAIIVPVAILALLLKSCDPYSEPIFSLESVFVAVAEASETIAPADVREAANILWGETTGDRMGWSAALNTYWKARRGDETLLQSMKRRSSAYRTKSRQYRKAHVGGLNVTERVVFDALVAAVEAFEPKPDWPYVHHEKILPCYEGDPVFYQTKAEAFAHLRKAWGPDVDLEGGQRIGCEHYFEKIARSR